MIQVLLLVFVLLATPAFAEWEAAVYGGGSFTNKTHLDSTGPPSLTLNHVKVDSSGTVGGKLGYWFTEISKNVAFGAGIDAFYFRPDIPGQTVDGQLGGTPIIAQTNPINVRTIGIGFDVLKLRVPLFRDDDFPNGRFFPTAGVGPALFISEFKLGNNKVNDTTIGLKAGGGAEFLLTQAVGLFAEYRFTHFKAEGSDLSGNLNTHHITGGVALHF